MERKIIEVVRKITEVSKYEVYLDEVDNKWHIEHCSYHSFERFDTKEEAEKEACKLTNLDIISKVATVLELDYGYNGKYISIKIN